MKLPQLAPHRADFVIWTEEDVPYGEATTSRGREVYGSEALHMLYVDPHNFWSTIPDDVVVGVLTDDNGLQYANKNSLQ